MQLKNRKKTATCVHITDTRFYSSTMKKTVKRKRVKTITAFRFSPKKKCDLKNTDTVALIRRLKKVDITLTEHTTQALRLADQTRLSGETIVVVPFKNFGLAPKKRWTDEAIAQAQCYGFRQPPAKDILALQQISADDFREMGLSVVVLMHEPIRVNGASVFLCIHCHCLTGTTSVGIRNHYKRGSFLHPNQVGLAFLAPLAPK